VNERTALEKDEVKLPGSSVIAIIIGIIILGIAGYFVWQRLYYMDCPSMILIPNKYDAGIGYDEARGQIAVFTHPSVGQGPGPSVRYNITVNRVCMEKVKSINETTGQAEFDIKWRMDSTVEEPTAEYAKVRR
jgi:hypothetical protein